MSFVLYLDLSNVFPINWFIIRIRIHDDSNLCRYYTLLIVIMIIFLLLFWLFYGSWLLFINIISFVTIIISIITILIITMLILMVWSHRLCCYRMVYCPDICISFFHVKRLCSSAICIRVLVWYMYTLCSDIMYLYNVYI